MRKSKLIIGLFLLVTLLKFAVNHTRHIWIYNTSSINESKELGSFISSYEIINIEFDIKSDSIKNLDDLVVWKEKQLTTEPFLIFFHPRKPTGRHSLVLKSKIFNDSPMLFAKLEGNVYSGNQQKTHTILTEDKFREEEKIVFYYNNKKSFCTIKIKEIEKHSIIE